LEAHKTRAKACDEARREVAKVKEYKKPISTRPQLEEAALHGISPEHPPFFNDSHRSELYLWITGAGKGGYFRGKGR
jgi:hypothetical protein